MLSGVGALTTLLRTARRAEFEKGFLQIVRKITAVRQSTPTAIIFTELNLKADLRLLRATKLWRNLATLPPGKIYEHNALDSRISAMGTIEAQLGTVHVQGHSM